MNKYRPSHSYVHKTIIKNVDFREKGEIKNAAALLRRRESLERKQVCSKGIHGCIGSLNRVKELSGKFIFETF